jgi:hypothetical protein
MFALTRPMVGPTRTLELRIDVECDADVNVSLSLGREQTHRRVPGPQSGHRSHHQSRPGHAGLVRRCELGSCPQDQYRRGRQPAECRAWHCPDAAVADADVSKVEHVTASEVKFSFEPVSWVPYRVAIACHPPTQGFTMAHCRLLVDGRIRAVLADIEVGNPKSKTVEFASVITDDPGSARAAIRGALRRACVMTKAFRAGMAVDPDQRAQIAAHRAPDRAGADAVPRHAHEGGGQQGFRLGPLPNYLAQVAL